MSSQLNSTDWDFLTAVACCVEFKVIFAKILLFCSYPHQRKHPFCKFMSHNFMLVSKCNLILKKDPWFFKTKKDVEKIKYDFLWIYKLLYCEILPTANFLKFKKNLDKCFLCRNPKNKWFEFTKKLIQFFNALINQFKLIFPW